MPQNDIERLTTRIKQLETTLDHLISWMSQSANSPISRSEAMQLLRMRMGEDK